MQLSYKETPTWVFSCENCEIFKKHFLTEHLRWLLLGNVNKKFFSSSRLLALPADTSELLFISCRVLFTRELLGLDSALGTDAPKLYTSTSPSNTLLFTTSWLLRDPTDVSGFMLYSA